MMALKGVNEGFQHCEHITHVFVWEVKQGLEFFVSSSFYSAYILLYYFSYYFHPETSIATAKQRMEALERRCPLSDDRPFHLSQSPGDGSERRENGTPGTFFFSFNAG